MAARSKTPELTEELFEYLVAHSSVPDPLLAELAAETAARDDSGLQVAAHQGPLLTLLARLTGGHRIVEVGTFTGYSSLCLARGLAPDGRLVCFDISAERTETARRYWQRAGVADRVELRLGPAAEGLAALPEEPTLDLAFLDADKGGYVTYLELLVPRLRPGGLLVADNTLYHGEVADAASTSPDVLGIRAFNDAVTADDRLFSVLLPVADGTTLALRR